MGRFFSPAIVALMLTLSLHAQTAPDAAELAKLLKEFLAGASRNDAAMHDRFWAEDLIYTGSSGRRLCVAFPRGNAARFSALAALAMPAPSLRFIR